MRKIHSGSGLVQPEPQRHPEPTAGLARGHPEPKARRPNEGVDMVDSYLTSLTSTRVSSIHYATLDEDRNGSVGLSSFPASDSGGPGKVTRSAKHQKPTDITTVASALPEVPPELPGLSLITWEEFVDDPSLLHGLYSSDKDDFIHFDSSLVCNFFHDSRMEPPTLGGPSGDGTSWTIFVDNYAQLRQVRDTMTTRISVLLVDLVKPNNEGTAACLVAINPGDEHIRRVLHLTMSRAMETLMNSRCFCIEIDLNDSIQTWCNTVLQLKCSVLGGRIILTNGDAVESCCDIESPAKCVLCFPCWAFKRIKYMMERRRRYDDTRIEFETSNIVLCTKSDTLKQYSEAAQLTNGERVIRRNKSAVTTATQTLHGSSSSLHSQLSLEEVDELAQDNDVMKRRGAFSPDVRGELPDTEQNDNARPLDDNNRDSEITYSTKHGVAGYVNPGFKADTEEHRTQSTDTFDFNKPSKKVDSKGNSNNNNNNNKIKSVMFKEEVAPQVFSKSAEPEMMKEVEAVARANAATTCGSNDGEKEPIPSPRSAFLLRPDTPYLQPPNKSKNPSSVAPLSPRNNNAVSAIKIKSPRSQKAEEVINEKIVKRQRKIGELLKDLVMSSSTTTAEAESENGGTQERAMSPELDQEDGESEDVSQPVPTHGPNRPAPVFPPGSTVSKKVKQTPVKGWNGESETVFPYTTDLINFPALSPEVTEAALEKFGAKKKKNKGKSVKAKDMLFVPRLNISTVEQDRNCFSDQDIADSDITDLETEPENAVSDTEGITSSRLLPVGLTSVARTTSSTSVESEAGVVRNFITTNNNNSSDLDTDLEITDCDVEESPSEVPKKPKFPGILPGARAAQELRGSSAKSRSAHARDYIPPSAQARRRGGNQNDSRRRYLALNSLRRKAYKLSLAQTEEPRGASRPQSAELLSYHSRAHAVTVMSQV
ncbi:uncharacterized protein LOC101847436 [Aplysia californica]|uniref:Uncharacterized protein LOC101847436 n=1 Tax=Aplysia californica TaxID=6500 RepID=A0ABM0JV69_APLCA|nr:uncharacterized protein LOC101847436 [Aplysia californica]